MTKKELVKNLSARTGFTQIQSEMFLDAFLISIEDAIKEGETVKISSFGTFGMKEAGERVAFNLHTKEKMTIPARLIPYFKFSPVIKNEIKKLPL